LAAGLGLGVLHMAPEICLAACNAFSRENTLLLRAEGHMGGDLGKSREILYLHYLSLGLGLGSVHSHPQCLE